MEHAARARVYVVGKGLCSDGLGRAALRGLRVPDLARARQDRRRRRVQRHPGEPGEAVRPQQIRFSKRADRRRARIVGNPVRGEHVRKRQTLPWVKRLFSIAVATQAADAQIKGKILAEMLGARPAVSGHPESGRRNDYDDMLNSVAAVVAPRGQRASLWQGEEVKEAVEQL